MAVQMNQWYINMYKDPLVSIQAFLAIMLEGGHYLDAPLVASQTLFVSILNTLAWQDAI